MVFRYNILISENTLTMLCSQ